MADSNRHPSFEGRVATATARGNGSVAGVFVFLLLGVFAVMSVLMVMLGAQLYHATVSQTEQSATERVMTSYVRTMLRGMDEKGVVSVETLETDGQSVPALVFHETYDDTEYVTQLYLWDGSLRELFTEAEYDFAPEDGEVILPLKRFAPSMDGQLVRVSLADEEGHEALVQVALRSAP